MRKSSKVLSRDERDKEWMKKSRKERKIDGVVYSNPAKKVGKNVLQLADVIKLSDLGGKGGMDDLRERYQHKKEGNKNLRYSIIKRKYHVEIWRTY